MLQVLFLLLWGQLFGRGALGAPMFPVRPFSGCRAVSPWAPLGLPEQPRREWVLQGGLSVGCPGCSQRKAEVAFSVTAWKSQPIKYN